MISICSNNNKIFRGIFIFFGKKNNSSSSFHVKKELTEFNTFIKMPGIEDWISSPLTIVDQAFQSHIKDGAQWPQTIEKYFEDKIGQDNNVQVKKN